MADARAIGAGVGGVVGTVFGPTGTAVGAAAGNFVGGLFSTREPEIGAGGFCAGQDTPETVLYVFAHATQQEIAEIQTMWAQGIRDMGEPFPTSPERFAWHMSGGSDCKVTTVTGKAIVAKWNALKAKYRPAAGITGEVSDTAKAQATQMDSTGLGGQIRQIGQNILDTATEIIRSTAGGAVAGATAATSGAATGARSGSFLSVNAIPLLLFGGGILLVMMLRRD